MHADMALNQQTPATLASELNESNSKRKVGIINKNKKRKWNDDNIKYGLFFTSKRRIKRSYHLLNVCFAVLQMETKVWFLRNYAIS